MSEVLTFGESMLVLRSQRTGHLRLGELLQVAVAGAESTVAIGLSRLGHDVEWCGPVGADEAGRLVRGTVLAEGVRATGAVDTSRPTGVLVRTERRPPRGVVDHHRAGSAAAALTRHLLREPLARTTRVVHATGITAALSPTAADALRHTLEGAHATGLDVSFDVNHRPRLTTRDAAGAILRDLLPHIDVLLVGDDELPVLAAAIGYRGTLDVDVALDLDVVPELVVKLGANGAASRVDGRRTDAPAPTVTVVDLVGAGDCFAAGYLSARLDGLDPHARLARGAVLGAACVAETGDWENLPTRNELDRLFDPSTSR